MTTTTTTDPQAQAITTPGRIDWNALPRVACEATQAQAVERLTVASRRGRMPGFRAGRAGDAFAFSAAVWGAPFDRELHGTFHAVEGGKGGGSSEIRFTSPLLLKTPIIFAIVIAFSIWPGVWLTDSLIPGEWGWIATWKWYLPITILPLFYYLPKSWNKSTKAAWASAHESIVAIAKELDGTIVP